MNRNDPIYVAGHTGLVGSAVVRELQRRGFQNIITATREEVDLTDPVAVKWFFTTRRIDYVFLCAAKVGGIKANSEDPLGFFLTNIRIQNNVILSAADWGIRKLLFLGSSCIYPRDCPQPILEHYLLTGPIERTTEPYALAKICGVRLCQWLKIKRGFNAISAMPCNIFGPGDNYDPESSHCIPGLIRRMHDAKERKDSTFKVWGNSSVRREFLYSDDLARALILCMERYEGVSHINTGSGYEQYMGELARTIARVIGYIGDIEFDDSEPIGTPRKVLENSAIRALGWEPQVEFVRALAQTYDAFLTDDSRK